LRVSLNLTQAIHDINKDKASDIQTKEQSPIVEKEEANIEKSVNISKESIKMGVKERTRAERDRDDSDFVYLKQTKKVCKETVPQAQADIINPDFDTTIKGKSHSTFKDLNESILYQCLKPKTQAIVKNFSDKATYE